MDKFYIHSPQEMPASEKIVEVREPVVKLDIFTPKQYLGAVLSLLAQRHGQYLDTEYLKEDLAVLHYRLPLAELLVNFYDQLKSISSGFASMNYELAGWQPCSVVRLDILVAESPVEALASLIYKDEVYQVGKKIVQALKTVIPRQQFPVKIQAAVGLQPGSGRGGKIIAAERLSALRKDVTARLYGGDYTRKRKLLEKQKAGKKKMAKLGAGKVELPPAAFLTVLKR